MTQKILIGIDVGSVSVNFSLIFEGEYTALLSPFKKIGFHSPKKTSSLHRKSLLLSPYLRHRGEPQKEVSKFIGKFREIIPSAQRVGICFTGTGGKSLSKFYDSVYVNSFQAGAAGIHWLYPDVRTVFEMGGDRTSYYRLMNENDGGIQILDYGINGKCAAGTGVFFDQQAARLRYDMDKVSAVLEEVEREALIAGRCSVFAKSDMIHAQQRGYSPAEVLKGLCTAVVRNYKGNVTKGRVIEKPVALIGGMASNTEVIRAVRKQFDLQEGEFIVPPQHAWIGAIGAALFAGKWDIQFDFLRTENLIEIKNGSHPRKLPLSLKKVRFLREKKKNYSFPEGRSIDAYLGIDVGSVSTNLALIDSKGDLIKGAYRMTEGRPIQVVQSALKDLGAEVDHRVKIKGVGTTGSGRDLIATVVGADVNKDEITAHKVGAVFIAKTVLGKTVDTIFDIGGQDSKFISLQEENIIDFSLNEACAAGTGSFLEELADMMDVSIYDEFAQKALNSGKPLRLGERCTVFMAKELQPYIHNGIPKEDILAGLAYSVAENYLSRVVKKKRIGDLIFFQGGTASNPSVAAALATLLDKEIIVPPHNAIMGAIGAALLSMDFADDGRLSSFRGWNLERLEKRWREFTCDGCSNICRMSEINIQGEKSYWGAKCLDRYGSKKKSKHKAEIPDLVRTHEDLIFPENHRYPESKKADKGRIGIPRILYFYDRLPFWRAYLESLGFEAVISNPSDQVIKDRGIEASVADPCFPIKLSLGHVLSFEDKNVDQIFLPNVIDEEDDMGSVATYLCPWTQTFPFVARHSPLFFRPHLSI